MKTKKISLAKRAAALFTITIGLLTSCQKNAIDSQAVQSNSSDIATASLQQDNGQVATDWYKLQLRIILNANPTVSNVAAVRLFGYTGISLFEAARFESSNSRSLHGELYQMPVMAVPDNDKKYSWVISANAALADITRDLLPGLTASNSASIDSLEKAYNDRYIAKAGANVVERSEAFGKGVAAAIFDWSKSDLFDHANDPYTPPVFLGAWVPAPPLFLPAAVPYLGKCRPFLSMHRFGTTPPPPYDYSDQKGSNFYKMANYLYNISQSLTQEQHNMALFWNDVGIGVGYTPMGHCISIITQILERSHASLATAEEAYVKAGIAMWDAGIVCWRSKFKYNQLRPVTYIQKNISSAWLPIIGTPPHPEYPAAHSFITSAVMETLGSVFGRGYDFTDHTYDFLGFTPRHYSSFNQCANECGQARVYGGIHYQPSVNMGHLFGELIGKDVVAIQLTQ